MAEVDSRFSLPLPNEPIVNEVNGVHYMSPAWYMFFHQLFDHKEVAEGFQYEEQTGEIEQFIIDLEDRLEELELELHSLDTDDSKLNELESRIDSLESEIAYVLSEEETILATIGITDRLTTRDSTPSTLILTDDETDQTLTGSLGALKMLSASGEHGLGSSTDDVDIVLTFLGTTNSGQLKWMEDEDYFLFEDNVHFALSIDIDGVCQTDSLQIDEGGSTSVSTGTGTVKMGGANNADSAAWIPINYAGTTYYVPAWTTYNP